MFSSFFQRQLCSTRDYTSARSNPEITPETPAPESAPTDISFLTRVFATTAGTPGQGAPKRPKHVSSEDEIFSGGRGVRATYLSYMAAAFSNTLFKLMDTFGRATTQTVSNARQRISLPGRRRLVVAAIIMVSQLQFVQTFFAGLASLMMTSPPPLLLTIVLGFDEAFQWITVSDFSESQLATFLAGMKELAKSIPERKKNRRRLH